jgi:hypothetical protein
MIQRPAPSRRLRRTDAGPHRALVKSRAEGFDPGSAPGGWLGLVDEPSAETIGRAAGRRLPRGLDAREFVLKHGPSPNHWNEYVFCAYSNYRNDAVFIAGVPDDRKSLPLGDLMRATS